MKFGVTMFPTDYSIDPATLAREVEQRGFDSLWLPEHTHIPASRQTPWPGGAELPKEYYHVLDPFVALTAAAMATDKLLIGTGICLVVEHNPITLAKAVASIDLISGGRFLFGVGAGWNLEEMANHGTAANQRFRLMRERVLAMKEIWTKDEAEFHGRLVDFDPLWSWPKPLQKPHPPVFVGGDGEHALRRVIAYGDAWMPIPVRGRLPLSERMKQLEQMAAEAGRGRIPVTVYGVTPRPEVISHYAEIGVERGVFWMPPAAGAEALSYLDRYAAAAEEAVKAGA